MEETTEESLQTRDFRYDLPPELIAQTPLSERDSSRLMVYHRGSGEIEHRAFRQITAYLHKSDVLVLNRSRVIPARLFGRRVREDGTAGGQMEFLLLKREGGNDWQALVKPGKRARVGARFDIGGKMFAEVRAIYPDGSRSVAFSYQGIWEELLDELGQMPLPPYITEKLEDKERYQTVYAREEGSAAAPTAGLHFTPELLRALRDMGVDIVEVLLHVGLGTFRPVKEQNIADHVMHSEYCEVSPEAAERINRAKVEGRRVICVGTTSCRTLESMADENGVLHAGGQWTDIFMSPGYSFRVVDGLVTNFHLPESTLLMLVSALIGREETLRAYEIAVAERYRFFSFGDAMLII